MMKYGFKFVIFRFRTITANISIGSGANSKSSAVQWSLSRKKVGYFFEDDSIHLCANI